MRFGGTRRGARSAPHGSGDVSGLRELADVGSGGEGALVAAEHDRANLLVPVELLQRAHELVHQLVGERVQPVGTVEQDDRDRLVALDED